MIAPTGSRGSCVRSASPIDCPLFGKWPTARIPLPPALTQCCPCYPCVDAARVSPTIPPPALTQCCPCVDAARVSPAVPGCPCAGPAVNLPGHSPRLRCPPVAVADAVVRVAGRQDLLHGRTRLGISDRVPCGCGLVWNARRIVGFFTSPLFSPSHPFELDSASFGIAVFNMALDLVPVYFAKRDAATETSLWEHVGVVMGTTGCGGNLALVV